MLLRRTAFVIAIAAVALSACGRRNEPITPYEAAQQAREEAKDAGEPLPPEPEKPQRDRPFILDGLIE